MEDRAIISLLFARAEQALTELAKKFGSGLHRLAKNITGSEEDAQECVNDTYLALWNAIPPACPDPLSAYAYRTGRNIALKRHRGNTAAKRGNSYDLSLDELAGCVADYTASESLDARLLGDAISRFLTEESRENRVLFLRRYWFADSYAEIAARMGLSEKAVSSRLTRLRKQLRRFLTEKGALA